MDPTSEHNDDHFVDIVINDDSDRSILPDAVLLHLDAGGDKAARAELERRAEAELDAEMAELEAEQAGREADEKE